MNAAPQADTTPASPHTASALIRTGRTLRRLRSLVRNYSLSFVSGAAFASTSSRTGSGLAASGVILANPWLELASFSV